MSRFDPYRDTPKAGDYSKNREVIAAGIMTDCAQILDVVKREWGSSWSGWDQDVCDRMTAWLQEHYQGFPHQPTGAKPGRQSSVGEPQPKDTN